MIIILLQTRNAVEVQKWDIWISGQSYSIVKLQWIIKKKEGGETAKNKTR